MKYRIFGLILSGIMLWSCNTKNEDQKKDLSNEPKEFGEFEIVEKSDWHSFQELLDQHAGLSFEKQLIFDDIIGDNLWQFDKISGTITFADTLIFPVQIIGSISFIDNSWLWGWANSKSEFPENLLVQSNQLKKLGEKKGIKELTEEHFLVDENFEYKIGLISSGLFKSQSYYCANYGQGTLVVTIDSEKIPDIDKKNFEKILSSFLQLISIIDLNHKSAFRNYLIDRDFRLKIADDKIEGSKNGKIIVGEFDKLSRLTNLSGDL